MAHYIHRSYHILLLDQESRIYKFFSGPSTEFYCLSLFLPLRFLLFL
jgi:hypothetical protein